MNPKSRAERLSWASDLVVRYAGPGSFPTSVHMSRLVVVPYVYRYRYRVLTLVTRSYNNIKVCSCLEKLYIGLV